MLCSLAVLLYACPRHFLLSVRCFLQELVVFILCCSSSICYICQLKCAWASPHKRGNEASVFSIWDLFSDAITLPIAHLSTLLLPLILLIWCQTTLITSYYDGKCRALAPFLLDWGLTVLVHYFSHLPPSDGVVASIRAGTAATTVHWRRTEKQISAQQTCRVSQSVTHSWSSHSSVTWALLTSVLPT